MLEEQAVYSDCAQRGIWASARSRMALDDDIPVLPMYVLWDSTVVFGYLLDTLLKVGFQVKSGYGKKSLW